jgi:hypothetical protein
MKTKMPLGRFELPTYGCETIAEKQNRRKIMIKIPENEKGKFESLLSMKAKMFGFSPEDYLRKVWYHEQAAELGEYIAISLLDELLQLLPTDLSGEPKMNDGINSNLTSASVP